LTIHHLVELTADSSTNFSYDSESAPWKPKSKSTHTYKHTHTFDHYFPDEPGLTITCDVTNQRGLWRQSCGSRHLRRCSKAINSDLVERQRQTKKRKTLLLPTNQP